MVIRGLTTCERVRSMFEPEMNPHYLCTYSRMSGRYMVEDFEPPVYGASSSIPLWKPVLEAFCALADSNGLKSGAVWRICTLKSALAAR